MPYGAHAEIDLVEIELQDFLLRKRPLDADGEQRLLELAVQILLVGQQEILGHLLGDGGGAFGPPLAPILEILVDRTRDAGEIQAAMLVEAPVLGRQESLNDHLRDDVDGHKNAPLTRVLRHQRTVIGMDARHDGRFVLCQPLVVRQILRGPPHVEADDRRGCQEQHHAGSEGEREQAEQPAALLAPPLGPRWRWRRQDLNRSHSNEIPDISCCLVRCIARSKRDARWFAH